MLPSASLATTVVFFLAIPAVATAQQGTREAEPFSAVEQSALEALGESHATAYPLIDSWFAGLPIQYYHFGATDPQPGTLYRVAGGVDVVTSLPGTPGYSAVRQVLDVELLPSAGVAAVDVKSHLVVAALLQQGRARLRSAGLLLNLPIVPTGSTLERDFAHRTQRTAYYRGRPVPYFDFGVTAPSAIPLIAFAQRFPEQGEDLEPVDGQPSNASAVPGGYGYSDLWNIQVAVGSAYKPGSYRDFRRVQADSRAGRILVRPWKVVFNRPVMYVDGKPASRPGPALAMARVAPLRAPGSPISAESQARLEGPAPAVPVTDQGAAPASSGSDAAAGRIYSGRARRLDIDLPRGAASTVVTMDGLLDEPVWQSAALLTGFSQYEPQDGLPAEDSTEVLVWYTNHAIYFGIRAFEPHGNVRAQLADRDKIDNDDHIQILLDTFNDRRRALYFAVNPLGRQADGIRNERGNQGGGGGGGGGGGTATNVDLAEDFQFQSKGRLTGYGYDIEVRIPFKSLRYQALPVQDWGIQVIRDVQHSQYTQTWTPAKRGSQSFLAQSGKLKGLTQLKRGLVMDLNPTSTAHMDGARAVAPATGWDYGSPKPEIGGNVRWGIMTNLTLNGTANPDFSQVEADVQQVQYDPRSSVSFPEKRPFFVEGSEQFDAPHNLIYTRRTVQPVAALKLNGKAGGANIGVLSAVDAWAASGTPGDSSYPVLTYLRLKKDIGPQSTIAMTATDRTVGSNWSRVASGDVRFVFARSYSFTGSYAHSFNHTVPTTGPAVNVNAPVWRFNLDKAGRRYSASYNIQGTHPLFQTRAGFVSRTNLSSASMDQRFTTFGKPGATLESHTFTFNVSATWWYDSLLALKEWNDPKLHLNNAFVFKGGWRATTNIFIETFRYDPGLYASYRIDTTAAGTATGLAGTVPYVGQHRILNIDISQSFNTPQFKNFRGGFNVIWGRDENFEEWAPAFIMFPTFTLNWTPSSKIRAELRYPLQLYVRLTDWSTVKRRQIPRLKLEYQANRAIFFRFVGQYEAQFRDYLRDASRTERDILLRSGTTYTRNTLIKRNDLRVDWLFSYQPSPGTVFFAGYGATLGEPEPFKFTDLARTVDGFFVKLSYLYRL